MTRPSPASMVRRIDRLIETANPGEERVVALLCRLRDMQPPEPMDAAKVKKTKPKRRAAPQTPITAILETVRQAITYAPREADAVLQSSERILTNAVARLYIDGFAALYCGAVPRAPSRESANDASQQVAWLAYAVDVSQIALGIERKTADAQSSSAVRGRASRANKP